MPVRLMSWLCGSFSFMIIDEHDTFSQPFIHDANAADVSWTYEAMRQVRRWGCHLALWEVHTPHFENSPTVCSFKRSPTSFPARKCAGTTAFMDFER